MLRALPTFFRHVQIPNLATVTETIHLWQMRAEERRRLATLDDHILRDIGIDRVSADKEAAKPFWRA